MKKTLRKYVSATDVRSIVNTRNTTVPYKLKGRKQVSCYVHTTQKISISNRKGWKEERMLRTVP